jgi:hypothetical protein
MTRKRSLIGPRPRSVGRVMVAIALLGVAALALGGVLGLARQDALTLLPLFLLIGILVLRPYAGERLIARLRKSQPRRAPQLPSVSRRPRRPVLARGGRLIATAMAGRAPPLALAR